MRFVKRLKSLNVKFLLLLLPPLVVVALALAVGHGYLSYRYAEKGVHIKHDRLSALFADLMGPHLFRHDPHVIKDILRGIIIDPDVAAITIFDLRGAKIASAEAQNTPKPEDTIEVVRTISLETTAGEMSPPLGSILVRFDLSRARTAALNEMARDIFSILLTVLIVIVGMIMLNRFLVTRPLRRLTASVKAGAMSDGSHQRVVWDSDDEIGTVIRSFNEAQERRKDEYAALQRSRRLLADSESRARAIAEAIPVPVIIEWLSDGTAVYTNATARQSLCKNQGELPPHLLSSLFVVDRERQLFFDSINRGDSVENQETLLARPSGGRFWGSLAARRIDLDGRRAVLCAIHDISDHREAEAALQAAKAAADETSRAKDLFLANTGHEIRTPLNAILGLSRLALNTDLTPEQWEHLNRIEISATLLLGLVDDVLDFSKIGTQELELVEEPFPFADLINAIAAIHSGGAEAKGLKFTVSQSGVIPPAVIGDSVRLARILNNLLSNAIKFTDSGEITLNILGRKAETPGRVILRFTVRDTGPGILPNRVPSMFKPFIQGDASLTRQHGGTGLGLAIVQSLVEQMGSKVDVDTRPGAGAAFSFELAFDEVSLTDTDQHAVRRTAPSLTGKRILVVEDNEINLIVVQKILQRAGAAIEPAENGIAALVALETEAQRFDAILMDIQMPEMDGHEATKKIRKFLSASELPIVALTANASLRERSKCLEDGMNDYLTKPVDPDILVATMARVMEGRDAENDILPPTPSPTPPPTAVSHEPAQHGDLPGLDVSDAMSRMGGDFDLFTELLRMFHGIYVNGLDAIQDPLDNGDLDEARRAAHSLKGVASNISAMALHKAAAKLETTIKERGSAEDIAEDLALVKNELTPVIETAARFA